MRRVTLVTLLAGTLVMWTAGNAWALRNADAQVGGVCFPTGEEQDGAILDAFVEVTESRADVARARATWKLYSRALGGTTWTFVHADRVSHATRDGEQMALIREFPPPPIDGSTMDWKLVVVVTWIRPDLAKDNVRERHFAASFIDQTCKPEGPPPPPPPPGH
jgi:hypothetical protein